MEIGVGGDATPFTSVDAENRCKKGEGKEDDGKDCEDHDGAALVGGDFGLFAREVRFYYVGLFLLHVEENLELCIFGDELVRGGGGAWDWKEETRHTAFWAA